MDVEGRLVEGRADGGEGKGTKVKEDRGGEPPTTAKGLFTVVPEGDFLEASTSACKGLTI